MRQESPDTVPPQLASLAREVRGLGWEAAKRLVVSKVGSVRRGERFDDDVADAVFLRLQQNAQVGRYASESELARLGRNARRLTGDGQITLFRSAPKGCGIRPGDFAAGTAHEAGFYRHGGNVVQSVNVPVDQVFQMDGSMGGGQEYVYLPRGYVPPQPKEWFGAFLDFFEAAHGRTPAAKDGPPPIASDADEPAPSPGMR